MRRIYANRITNAIGNGLVNPFIEYYGARLNATPMQLSTLQGVLQLVPNLFQVAWGWWSDRVARRLPFVMAGTTLVALSYAALALASVDIYGLILIMAAYALGVSVIAPSWTAFVAENAEKRNRGEMLAVLSLLAGIASIMGILITGIIFAGAHAFDSSVFRMVFLSGALFTVFAILALVGLKEGRARSEPRPSGKGPVKDDPRPAPPETAPGPATDGRKGFWMFVRGSDAYRYFLAVQCFFVFSMALIWGLIPVTVTRNLGATNVDLVLLALSGAIPVLLVQRAMGRAADRLGALPMLQLTRLFYVPVPIVYAFASSIFHIIAIEIVLSAAVAVGNIAYTVYILDLTPAEHHAQALGFYSALTGVSAFAGVMLGGGMAQILGAFLGVSGAMIFVYLLSALGRGVGSAFYLHLRPLKLPGNIRSRIGEVLELHRFWKRHKMA